jgi:hypothetical protein
VSSGYSATFFAASNQRNSNNVQGIFMYEKFNTFIYIWRDGSGFSELGRCSDQ